MSVYVDSAYLPYGNMQMCHMVADSLEELHDMADRIGIQRRWFQNKPGGTPHYDISKSKRALAVQHGTIEIDNKKLVEIILYWRDQRAK